MAFADLFSSSFLFSVAIILILVGGLYAYFSYKMAEQDHKISSMFSLVKTMAGEVQYLRSRGSGPTDTEHEDQEDEDQEQETHVHTFRPPMTMERALNYYDRIVGQEDEEHEDEEQEDGDEEQEDDNQEGGELVDVSDCDDDLDSESGSESGEDSVYDESVNNVAASLSIDESDTESIGADDIGDINELDAAVHNSEFNTKTIHLEDTIDLSEEEPIVVNDFKGDLTQIPIPHIEETIQGSEVIDVSLEQTEEKPDYKKMSLNKLREIVVEQGITVDASKLKKGELLKMLGSE